jgi:DNA-directed RNA polymerase specialized sigma24 family protein
LFRALVLPVLTPGLLMPTVVYFRYFAGLTMNDSADLLGLSLRSTHRLWAYAKAWLLQELERD